MSKRHLTLLCPSAPMKPGAALLGVVAKDGQIDFAPPGLVVDEEFVRTAAEGRDPLLRFRFSSPCTRGGCAQWKGDHCGVTPAVMAHAEGGAKLPEALPDCSIRERCRWFHERGPAACDICPDVITNQFVGRSGAE